MRMVGLTNANGETRTLELRTTTLALARALTALAMPATGMAATGQVTEFPLPTAGAQPFAITAGPDGNLWFTEGGSQKVGRITPAGSIKRRRAGSATRSTASAPCARERSSAWGPRARTTCGSPAASGAGR